MPVEECGAVNPKYPWRVCQNVPGHESPHMADDGPWGFNVWPHRPSEEDQE